MLKQFTELKGKFIGLKHQLEKARRDLRKTNISLTFLKHHRKEWIMGRDFFIEIAKITQNTTKSYLEDTVSLSLSIIPTDRPMKLIAEFETRRNQPELDLFIQEGKGEPIPLHNKVDQVGKSVEEIVAYASRLSLWYVENPKTSPLQVQDEPFGTLKKENLQAAVGAIKQIQQEFGLQMVLVTHEPELMECADKIFRVTKTRGKSIVEEV